MDMAARGIDVDLSGAVLGGDDDEVDWDEYDQKAAEAYAKAEEYDRLAAQADAKAEEYERLAAQADDFSQRDE